MYNKYLKLPYIDNKGELLLKNGNDLNRSMTLEEGKAADLVLRVPSSLGCINALLRVYKDGEDIPSLVKKFTVSSFKAGIDEFCLRIGKHSLKSGLYFLDISLNTDSETLYVTRRLGEVFVVSRGENSGIQLTVSSFEYKKPEALLGGIIYHIFVDRFSRGKGTIQKEGNIVVEGEWDRIPEFPEYPGAPLKNNTFYGGNLDGVRERLPYLSSLGVSVIYLSPIFESVSNHKYDTSDYMKVDSCFGGDKALKKLILEAKKYGISIVLDGVFNHTGDDSIYFNRYGRFDTIGAYQSKDSPYYDWYDFRSFPDDYNCWWGIKILPRIHPDKKACKDYFLRKGGVVDKYRKMGIYGFRLDVADELSDEFIGGIKQRLSECGESYLLGEVWEDGSNKTAYGVRKSYYQGKELDGVMNYPIRTGLIDYLTEKKTDSLRYALTDIIDNAPKRIRDAQMNILGTHDTARILTLLSGKKYDGLSNRELSEASLTESERKLGIRRLLMAYTVISTLPGIPSIYYGDEAGLQGFSDPFNRMPYPYGREEKKVLDFYRKIGIIRRENSVYKEGNFELISLDSDSLVFSRSDDKSALITFINNGAAAYRLESDVDMSSLIDGVASKSLCIGGTTPAVISLPVGSKIRIYRG